MQVAAETTRLDGAVLQDRRRPGRRDVHPSLIPLMRGTVSVDVQPEIPADLLPMMSDELAPAVGIARGVGIMCLVWAVGTVAYALI